MVAGWAPGVRTIWSSSLFHWTTGSIVAGAAADDRSWGGSDGRAGLPEGSAHAAKRTTTQIGRANAVFIGPSVAGTADWWAQQRAGRQRRWRGYSRDVSRRPGACVANGRSRWPADR